MASKFPLGQVVATRGIVEEGIVFLPYLKRHEQGDWGDLGEEDIASNESALAHGNDRLFSAYDTEQGRIWIITEWDRSVTTILFPEDY